MRISNKIQVFLRLNSEEFNVEFDLGLMVLIYYIDMDLIFYCSGVLFFFFQCIVRLESKCFFIFIWRGKYYIYIFVYYGFIEVYFYFFQVFNKGLKDKFIL